MRNFRKFRRGILRGQMDTRIAVNLCGSTRGTKKVWLFESRHEAKTTLRPLILITLLFTAVEEVSRGGAGERGGRRETSRSLGPPIPATPPKTTRLAYKIS